MIRVLFFLGLVLALAFGFAWLADRPGQVAIDWMGYQVELSAMVAMIAVLALLVAVMATWWVLKVIIRSPQIMGGYFSARRRDKGYEALSSGLVAAGSGDARAVQRYTKQAKKYVPDAALTQVLSAASADLSGDDAAKRQAYRRMLDDPKTQLLGLRGLYLDAVDVDDEEAARHYADKAAALAPSLPWAGEAQFEDQVQRSDWPAARAALERNLQARIVTKAERNRLRAVLLAAEALDREEGEPDSARPLAMEAHKLAPDLVPAAAVAGRLLIRAGKMSQASKVLETTWKRAPHPELAEVYLYVRPGDAVADRVKRAGKLAQLIAHAAEGELALARALMEAGRIDEARKTVEPLLDTDATQRVCLLMAEIEEKAGGQTAAVRGWLARALRAKRDAAWVADGYISSTWEPVSPLSGRVDAFEWKVPVERFAGHDPVAIPDDAMSEDGQVLLPARFPGVEASMEVLADVDAVEAAPELSAVDGVQDDTVEAAMTTGDDPKSAQAEPAAQGASVVKAAAAAAPVVVAEAAVGDREPPRKDPADDLPEESDAASVVETKIAADEDVPPVTNVKAEASERVVEPVLEPDGHEALSAEVGSSEQEPVSTGKQSDATEKDGQQDDETGETLPQEETSRLSEGATVTPLPRPADEADSEDTEPYTGLPRGKAPDDPGPVEEAEDSPAERRRFRLF